MRSSWCAWCVMCHGENLVCKNLATLIKHVDERRKQFRIDKNEERTIRPGLYNTTTISYKTKSSIIQFMIEEATIIEED